MSVVQTVTERSIVLNSWKEIAAYMGRGVRTVQRYERDLALPVRRPRGKLRSAVIAMSDELDAWLRNAPRKELENHVGLDDEATVVPRVHQSMSEGVELCFRCADLRAQHRVAIETLIANLSTMHECLKQAQETRGGGVFPWLRGMDVRRASGESA